MATGTRSGPVALSAMSRSWWQGVVYGPPGCGKTTFACASTLPTFVFDVDHGMNAAASWRVKHGIPLDNCIVWPIETTEDFDAATTWLVANMGRFQLVVVDSATELQRIIIAETCKKTKQQAPDQRAWGVIRTISESLTVRFRYMPLHLVYTCHEINKYDADYERDVWRPSFDGRFAFEYAKHFSWIARLIVAHAPTGAVLPSGKPETAVIRALRFGPDPYMHFKDRSGSMQQYEHPHLDGILHRMMASTTVGGHNSGNQPPAITA